MARNPDGTVTLKTKGRDKRGNTGGSAPAEGPGPLGAAAPATAPAGTKIRLVTKKRPVDRTAYQ